MAGFSFLALLKELHNAGYTAMTLAAASALAVIYMQFVEHPAESARLAEASKAAGVRITGVEKAVESIQAGQLEVRLDQAYAALCMLPGDGTLLERIRDLQKQYQDVTGGRYPPPNCDLLLKLR